MGNNDRETGNISPEEFYPGIRMQYYLQLKPKFSGYVSSF